MDELRQDLRYAVRSLMRRPAFAAVAIATLALGIGINAGMFSVIRSVLLAPLPYAAIDELVRVQHVNREGGPDDGQFSPQDFEDFAYASRTLSSMAGYFYAPGMSDITLTGSGDAAILEAAFVTPQFFATLGVAPTLGRLPTAEEMQSGQDRVVVLSEREWRTRFGSEPGVVGTTVTVDNAPYAVLGVMPAAFAYPSEHVQVWLPASLITEEDIPRERFIRYLDVVGRLAPGVDRTGATAELDGIAAGLAGTYPESNEHWRSVRLQPVQDHLLGSARTPLLVLWGAVGFVLLIACANLVNLLLARASSRRGEFAVRSTLGAGRGRIVRQLVTESTLLALVGGGIGVVLAMWMTSTLLAIGGADLPRMGDVTIDGVVIGFALALSLLTGVLTGVIPAWRATDSSAATLREDGRSGTESVQRQRVRGVLIAAEMTLAVVLVISAGLMLRSLTSLLRADPGFAAEQVLTVSLRVPAHRAESMPESVVYRNLLMERLSSLPGVRSVAAAKTLPLDGGGEPFTFTIPAQSAAEFRPDAGVMIVSPAYFETLGIPVVNGRAFDERETRDAQGMNPGMKLSLMINETAARRHFPGVDPVGQTVTFEGDWHFQIVGVAGDVRHAGLHEAPPATAYVPIDIMPRSSVRLMMRVHGDPRMLVAGVRSAIRELEPGQPILEIIPLRDTVRRAAARERFLATLLSVFAAFALLLAAIGIYGVVAYNVTQRMHEMGIRMALGANPAAVIGMIVAQSAQWWGAGLALGIVLAFALTRVLRSLLYETSVTDATTFAVVGLLLGGAALLASVIPAWRASRADPTSAFR
jgi:predicted permease